jgi:hypothetical protein
MHYFDHFYCGLCPFNPTRVSELYSSIFGGSQYTTKLSTYIVTPEDGTIKFRNTCMVEGT